MGKEWLGRLKSLLDKDWEVRRSEVAEGWRFLDQFLREKEGGVVVAGAGEDEGSEQRPQLRWAKGAGTIQVDGVNFTLQQCHWHSHIEHLISGRRYPLEKDMVHQIAGNRIVVIVILYNMGNSDAFLIGLRNEIVSLSHNTTVEAEERFLFIFR
ncbi:alpha carbonic anhydrase 7-like [Cryptomeria japonica]|uniref:alpha carbonic anhydrase 7-like n=1 Tax=Cryptomeria japonica TaxID=3369 RepID=UPI0027DA29E2|nr:alpha carbonic anhydrase 7-like [Cryptomeria japonica]